MANYDTLKATIDAYIRANYQKAITGPVLNGVLTAMVDSLGAGYLFMGTAVPSTNPGAPDQAVCYLAWQSGAYINFDGRTLNPDDIGLFLWDGSWTYKALPLAKAAALALKQDLLVSGVNIKTINGGTILGSGDIVIQGGGASAYYLRGTINVSPDTPVVSITEGTFAEAVAAYNDGSPVYAALVESNGTVNLFPLAFVQTGYIAFSGLGDASLIVIALASDDEVNAFKTGLVLPSDLAPVATSGNYDDLDNKPTIPSAQVPADWDQADPDAPDFIKNKPTIPAAQVQSDWDEADNTDPAFIKNKPTIPTVPTISTDIVSDRNSNDKTTSPKATFDGIGKYGVISQTQTWTQAADGGYDYVMSNPVMGLIPQANIDLYEAAGATFNAVTGYFELNGLTDISYEEMQAIYKESLPMLERINLQAAFAGKEIRTNLFVYHIPPTGPYGSITMTDLDYRAMCYECGIEVFALMDTDNTSSPQARFHITNNLSLSFGSQNVTYIQHLKKILGVVSIKNNSTPLYRAFYRCFSLESVIIYGLNAAIDFSQSSRLDAQSIATMIIYAGTATFTITLHATAYARATADTDVQAALAAHTNVTLASA